MPNLSDPSINPAAPKKVTLAERRIIALELRKKGMSYRKIAAAVLEKMAGRVTAKYSATYAYNDCMTALRDLMSTQAELAKENLRLDLERLDDLLSVAMNNAGKGDLMSLNACLAIIDRRARLLGYERAVNFTANLDVTQLSTKQLERIANGEDPLLVVASGSTSGT